MLIIIPKINDDNHNNNGNGGHNHSNADDDDDVRDVVFAKLFLRQQKCYNVRVSLSWPKEPGLRSIQILITVISCKMI